MAMSEDRQRSNGFLLWAEDDGDWPSGPVYGCPTCSTTGGVWSCPVHSPHARLVSINPHVSPLPITEDDVRRIVREELRNSLRSSRECRFTTMTSDCPDGCPRTWENARDPGDRRMSTCEWAYKFGDGPWRECGQPADETRMCESHRALNDRLGPTLSHLEQSTSCTDTTRGDA